ncbi:MAG TPA: CHRD domain-containing protein [Caulobacteraceae bacterium]|nr:CHRD domain-containing protein [Caulobacteraceae bacterium]
MRTLFIAALAAGSLLMAGSATARIVHFTAKLDGPSETPPKAVAGTGSADVTLDTATRTLSWTVDYSGLTGPATMAHFHGPAPVGEAAGVQIPFKGDLASPAKGMATLTERQIGDLEAGRWYVNVHTAQYPAGEIRGQLLKAE